VFEISGDSIKQITWIIFGWMLLGCAAYAASFDCTKAQSKVEHLICDNTSISKLDEELNAAYKTALQDEKQADSIKQAQKQWMKERNGCVDADCVRSAYEARLHELSKETEAATPSAQVKAGVSILPQEADKTQAIKRIMAKEKFFSTDSYAPEKSFCGDFLQDFQQMQGIEFVEPVAQSEKYDDPVWNTYKKSCPDLELFGGYHCEPRIADHIESLPKGEQKQMMNAACELYRGTEKLKLFKVDINDNPGDGIESVFYNEHEQGPLNKPSERQIDTNGGYWVVDLKRCQKNRGVLTNDPYSYNFQHPLENYNGIISYKGKHYIFDLFELDVKARTPEKTTYDLTLSGFSNFGKKKKPWLGPICSFNTLVTNRK
jgi:uncharacterized protein